MEISENTKPTLESSSSIYIPEWFLFEILCRLPWKSVFRFKCVSKQLLTMINDPAFVRIYISRVLSSSKPLPWTFVTRPMLPAQVDHHQPCRRQRLYHFERNLLLDSNSPSISKLVIPRSTVKSCQVVAISNGMCLCTCEGEKSYSIFNPVTKQFVLLPSGTRKLEGCATAFQAHFDQVGVVNYKMAHFLIDWDLPRTHLKVEEFSSETFKWTSFTAQFPEPISNKRLRTPFSFKGIFHWVDCQNYDGPHRIVSYDPVHIIHCPGSGWMQWCGEIMTAGGEQTIRCIKKDIKQNFIYVRRLRDYEQGIWQLEHKFALSEIILPYTDNRILTCHDLLNIALLPSEPDLLYSWGIASSEDDWMLVSFNVRSRKSRVIDTIPRVRCIQELKFYPFVLPPWPAILPHPSQ